MSLRAYVFQNRIRPVIHAEDEDEARAILSEFATEADYELIEVKKVKKG